MKAAAGLGRSPEFPLTRWTLVHRLKGGGGADTSPSAREAMEEFCRAYWYPLYFVARRLGLAKEDAEDAVQELFGRLIERRAATEFEASKGRLRGYLLACLKNGIASGRLRAAARKRGGGGATLPLEIQGADGRYRVEPQDRGDSPERAYERKWALEILGLARRRLGSFYALSGRERLHEVLAPGLVEDADWDGIPAAAAALGMKDGAARVALHRMRKAFGEILRDAVSETVAEEEDVEEEMQYLIALFGRD